MKKVHIGRGSSGRRVNLVEFVLRQRRRTRARLSVMNRTKARYHRAKLSQCHNPALAKETWKRGRREGGPRYMRSNNHVRTLKSFRLRRPSENENKLTAIATEIMAESKQMRPSSHGTTSVKKPSKGKKLIS